MSVFRTGLIPTTSTTLIMVVLLGSCGCMPKIERPPLDGQLSHKEANSQMFDMQAKRGNRFTADLQWNGKPFQANWEISNFLHRNVQLQIKPPVADFTPAELAMALETALSDEEHSPWHGIANDTVIRCYRNAWQNEDSTIAGDIVPDAPYEVEVKVKQNGPEWFLQVKIHVSDNPAKAPDLFL